MTALERSQSTDDSSSALTNDSWCVAQSSESKVIEEQLRWKLFQRSTNNPKQRAITQQWRLFVRDQGEELNLEVFERTLTKLHVQYSKAGAKALFDT